MIDTAPTRCEGGIKIELKTDSRPGHGLKQVGKKSPPPSVVQVKVQLGEHLLTTVAAAIKIGCLNAVVAGNFKICNNVLMLTIEFP